MVEGFGQQIQSRSGESRTGEDALGPPEEGAHIEEDICSRPGEGDVSWERKLATPVPRTHWRTGSHPHHWGRRYGHIKHGRKDLCIQKPKGARDLFACSSQEEKEFPECQEGQQGLGLGLTQGEAPGAVSRQVHLSSSPRGLVCPSISYSLQYTYACSLDTVPRKLALRCSGPVSFVPQDTNYHINSKFTSDQNYKILQYMCDTCGNMTVCDTCGDGNSMSEMSHITPKFLVLLLKMYNRLL